VVTPSSAAIFFGLALGSAMAAIAIRIFETVILRGRPPFRPRARAALRPACVRSETRSNSASAAKTERVAKFASQIQALDRTQPGLPMKKSRAGTMTHDYKRHGTTTLFAALDVLTGVVIGNCMPAIAAGNSCAF
jgi:hypothetical protein